MVGRRKERRLLLDATENKEAEFVVVYGRRRVGKTYLIRETFGNKFTFYYAGIYGIEKAGQLNEFERALKGYGHTVSSPLRSWFDAFDELRSFLQNSDDEKRTVFIDEMPWMDNKKSDFLPALEHFWNGWASGEKNLTFIVCGSATSWITKKIFRNKGGLYNRVTLQIKLNPFTLAECKEYFDSNGISMNHHDIIECYMVFGGIPYYLNMIDRKYGLPGNIDRLCFADDALLRNEYVAMFDSIFDRPEKYTEAISAINRKKMGITREELAEALSFPDGGNLTRILNELEECGFIRSYRPFGKKKNGALIQIADPFACFYHTWLSGKSRGGDISWSALYGTGAHSAWSGYAFEQVCFSHIEQIKKALGISSVLTSTGSWRSSGRNSGAAGSGGAQVDLLLDRSDNVINLCELKYSNKEFSIDKQYDLALRRKAGVFAGETKTKKAIHLTMVTTFGVSPGIYNSVFQSEVTMDDLFAV
jgi:AAA+ ATPase superfamily predicted ATPase